VIPHLDAAYRFARWLSYSPAEAEDVAQDALLRAWRGFEGLRGSDVKPWLLAIVRNCHFTASRRHRKHIADPLPEEGDWATDGAMTSQSDGPETVAILRDEARELDRLIAGLPEEQRVVLMLREVEEMGYAQIAAVINVPIGTVMSRLARSRASLKARWLDENRESPRAMR
jgi:RNA polymerase sigma-70 factor (ECF subfamily)